MAAVCSEISGEEPQFLSSSLKHDFGSFLFQDVQFVVGRVKTSFQRKVNEMLNIEHHRSSWRVLVTRGDESTPFPLTLADEADRPASFVHHLNRVLFQNASRLRCRYGYGMALKTQFVGLLPANGNLHLP